MYVSSTLWILQGKLEVSPPVFLIQVLSIQNPSAKAGGGRLDMTLFACKKIVPEFYRALKNGVSK